MACHVSPPDKRKFLGDVGQDLVQHHGKKKYYSQQEVKDSCRRKNYLDIDWHCWAYCIFTSPDTFEEVHRETGETCNYAEMKAEALTDLSGGSFELPDLDLSWLEWPDIDLGSIFDWFDLT